MANNPQSKKRLIIIIISMLFIALIVVTAFLLFKRDHEVTPYDDVLNCYNPQTPEEEKLCNMFKGAN